MNKGSNSHAGNILLQINSEGQRSTKYTGGDTVKIWIWANYRVNIANNKLPTFVYFTALVYVFLSSACFKFHSEIIWHSI